MAKAGDTPSGGGGGGELAKYLIEIGLNVGPITRSLNQIEKRIEDLGKKKAALSQRATKEEMAQLRVVRAQAQAELAKLRVQQAQLRVQQAQSRAARSQNRGVGDAAYFQARKQRAVDRIGFLRGTGQISGSDFGRLSGSISNAKTIRELSIVGMKIKSAAEFQKQLNREFTVGGFLANKMRTSVQQMAGGYVGAFAVAAGATNVATTGMAMESARAAMLAAAGGPEGRDMQIQYIKELSRYLGTDFKENADAYAKFLFAAQGSLSTGQSQALFTGAQEFGTTMGVDAFRMNLGMRALQQMMSKTKVSAEELRQQLNEAIPGSSVVFQRAFERMTGEPAANMFKWMEDGKLLAKDILPYVAEEFANAARQGGALDAVLKKTRVTMGQAKQAYVETADAMFQAGLDEGLGALFIGLKEWLTATRPLWVEFANVLGKILKITGKLLEAFGTVYESVENIIEAITGSRGNTLYIILGLWLARVMKLTHFFKVFIRAVALLGAGGAVLASLRRGLMMLATAIAIPLAKFVMLYGILEEIGNLFASKENKKWGVLSNPAGTGALDLAAGVVNRTGMGGIIPENHPAAAALRQAMAESAARRSGGSAPIQIDRMEVKMDGVEDPNAFAEALNRAFGASPMISGNR